MILEGIHNLYIVSRSLRCKSWILFTLSFLVLPFGLWGESSTINTDSLELEISQKSGLEQIQFLNSLSRQYRTIEPEMAVAFGERAFQLASEEKNAFETANALHNIGMVFYLRSDYNDAMGYFKQAVVIRDSIKDIQGYCNSLASIANIQNFWGNYYTATEGYNEVLTLREQIDDERGVATTMVNLGMIYRVQGNLDLALDMYMQAAAKSDTIGFTEGKAWAIYNVAMLYKLMGQYDKALQALNRSIEIYRELKDNPKGVALCYNEFGTIYNSMGEADKVLQYHEQALAIYSSLRDTYGIARTYTDFGNFYFSHEDFRKALDYYEKSYELRIKINDAPGRIQTAQAIAASYAALKMYDTALQYYKVAQKIASEENMLSTMEENFKGMSEIYAAEHLYEQAYDFSRKYSDTKDSLFSSRITSRIADLQVKYETERSHRENDILRKNNEIQELRISRDRITQYFLIIVALAAFGFTIILFNRYRTGKVLNKQLLEQKEQLSKLLAQLKQRETELEALNATKDRFFSIVSHDLRGPVGAFYRLTDALVKEIKTLDSEDFEEALYAVNKSAEQLYKLLENLLEWARIQLGKFELSPQHINLADSVSSTINALQTQAQLKEITIETIFPQMPVTVLSDPDMLSTILRNLISNAIKFTPLGGRVKIFSEIQNDHFVRVTVSDNGVGMEPEFLANLFKVGVAQSRVGTAKEQGTGLGLILCKDFVEKQGGQITVDSKIKEGTIFTFTLPIANS